jgi:isopenicillin N synthase-like dioxygenase
MDRADVRRDQHLAKAPGSQPISAVRIQWCRSPPAISTTAARSIAWRERVRIGSDRKQSGTARENLRGIDVEFPDELPDMQKRLVDFAAPGLRAILGYV